MPFGTAERMSVCGGKSNPNKVMVDKTTLTREQYMGATKLALAVATFLNVIVPIVYVSVFFIPMSFYIPWRVSIRSDSITASIDNIQTTWNYLYMVPHTS